MIQLFSRTSLAVIALLIPVHALAADAAPPASFFDQWFANAQGGTPCYGRSFDDAHLNAHTKQLVRRIEIDMTKSNASGIANTAERFELGFGLMLAKSAEWYGQAAICKSSEASADCFLEGDGGRFKLTPMPDGALKLETGDYGIALEGASDTIALSGSDGDDRVFLLKAARDECDAAAAFFKSDTDKPGAE